MSILWYDGFDQYGTTDPTDGKWSQFVNVNNSGHLILTTAESRTSSPTIVGKSVQCTDINTTLRRSLLGNFQTVGAGFGLWLPVLPSLEQNFSFFQWRDVNNITHMSISVGTTGRLQVWTGSRQGISGVGTKVGESTFELRPGVWNYIECKCTLGNPNGAVSIRLNGVPALTLNVTGINTIGAGSTPAIAQVAVCCGTYSPPLPFNSAGFYIDDLVVWDSAGAGNNDFLGLLGVYALRPTADTHLDWTPDSGSTGWNRIDQLSPDDTQKISDTIIGNYWEGPVEPLPSGIARVVAVTPSIRARKDGTGDCSIQAGVVSGGFENLAVNVPLLTNYGFFEAAIETNPNGGGAWSPTAMPHLKVKKSL